MRRWLAPMTRSLFGSELIGSPRRATDRRRRRRRFSLGIRLTAAVPTTSVYPKWTFSLFLLTLLCADHVIFHHSFTLLYLYLPLLLWLFRKRQYIPSSAISRVCTRRRSRRTSIAVVYCDKLSWKQAQLVSFIRSSDTVVFACAPPLSLPTYLLELFSVAECLVEKFLGSPAALVIVWKTLLCCCYSSAVYVKVLLDGAFHASKTYLQRKRFDIWIFDIT